MQRRTYAGQGVSLSGLEAGPVGGPLVILLHGFPEDAQSWEAQIEALAAAGMRVLAPDQRGYGESDKPHGVAAYGLGLLAADVAALATGLGHTQFDVVGHDWGGVVAWWVAARYPERLRRLAILNAPHPSALGPFIRRAPSQLLHSAYIGLFQLPALPEVLLLAANSWLLTEILRRSSRPHAFSAEELARYRREWARPGAMTAMLNWYRAAAQAKPSAGSGRIGAPTLVLWGAGDRFLQRGLAQASADLCNRAEVVYFEDATHWLQHDEPNAVNAALLRFMDI